MELQPPNKQPVDKALTDQHLLKVVIDLEAEVKDAKVTIKVQAEKICQLEEENKLLKKKLYGSSTERSKNRSGGHHGGGSGSGSKPSGNNSRVRSLTEKYPLAEVENKIISFDTAPMCQCCHGNMVDSGLKEISEYLHTIPAVHKIIRQIRCKYKCPRCFMGLLTAPLPPRIAPGSSLGDSFIIEAGMAKFYHLNPSERYAGMISLSGLENFPPQLVLAAQHYLAEFLRPVYLLIREFIKNSLLLFADETTHRMLEGSDTKGWYVWGFTAQDHCYLEIHPTRSGDVAIEFLLNAKCIFLMSDVYTGYGRAIREINILRNAAGLSPIIVLYCNSHSRRKFVEALINFPEEAQFFIDQYKVIYKLESELKLLEDPKSRQEKRFEMRPFFEAMKNKGAEIRGQYSDKSSLVKAIDYFINNYAGFTRFLEDPALPIDNNISERQLRNPVIGRKTWYGTHSERGAETTEILFTILLTCRLQKINPRDYLKSLVNSMHNGDPPFIPSQFRANPNRQKIA